MHHTMGVQHVSQFGQIRPTMRAPASFLRGGAICKIWKKSGPQPKLPPIDPFSLLDGHPIEATAAPNHILAMSDAAWLDLVRNAWIRDGCARVVRGQFLSNGSLLGNPVRTWLVRLVLVARLAGRWHWQLNHIRGDQWVVRIYWKCQIRRVLKGVVGGHWQSTCGTALIKSAGERRFGLIYRGGDFLTVKKN
jgi:hypothetical protein